MKLKMLIAATLFLFAACFASTQGLPVTWDDNRAVACDFPGNDLKIVLISGEECEPLCEETMECTHYVWTTENGGTCTLKSGFVSFSDAVFTGEKSTVCGLSTSGNVMPTRSDVKTGVRGNFDGGHDAGACLLPKADYATPYPIALGDVPELEELAWRPELCGHVLTIDCGHGPVDVIVANSNLKGGIDMYAKTWKRVTGSSNANLVSCSVALSTSNAFRAAETPLCYHAIPEASNEYFRMIALFNTNDKLVVGASLNGVEGVRDGAYFKISTKAAPSDFVVFRYEDGGEYSLPLSACQDGGEKETWN